MAEADWETAMDGLLAGVIGRLKTLTEEKKSLLQDIQGLRRSQDENEEVKAQLRAQNKEITEAISREAKRKLDYDTAISALNKEFKATSNNVERMKDTVQKAEATSEQELEQTNAKHASNAQAHNIAMEQEEALLTSLQAENAEMQQQQETLSKEYESLQVDEMLLLE